ncbi:MAG: PepSY domain-containing protein [Gammaproteobacteria bacterium]|nr:MAG: PepSY domain-containing protein [Gammaproteobacteria bacterium]
MKRRTALFTLLALVSVSCFALGKKDVRKIIEAAYPGARITEIEKETYRGEKIYEVDFKHGGENLEAIISLEGEIIKVHIDD